MTAEYQESQHHSSNAMGVVAGMFVGALAGAVTVLLLAPQSAGLLST